MVRTATYGGASTENYFTSIAQLAGAAKNGHLSVLYLYDGSNSAAVQKAFEEKLFKNESVAIAMKPFKLFKLDVSKDSVAKDLYAKRVPCFLVYNARGKQVTQAVLRGGKAKASIVLRALTRGAKGHGRLPLSSFIKKYRRFLTDLDKVEVEKKLLTEREMRAEGKKGKLRKIHSERARLVVREKRLLQSEKRLLASTALAKDRALRTPVAKRN